MNRKPTYQELEQKIKALEKSLTEALRRQDALPQRNERKYRILTESNADIVYRMDAFGNFTSFNSAAVKLTGYLEADLIGKSLSDIVCPDYRAEVERFYSRQYVRKTPITYFELPILTRDKEELWLGQNVHLIVDNNQIIGLHAIARDITARKQTERSEKMFATIFHLILDPMAITDMATGKIISANPAFAQWTGYAPDEFLGASTVDLNIWVHAEDREAMVSELKSIGEIHSSETIMRQRNGQIRNVLFSARIIDLDQKQYLLTFVHDITEYKQAQKALEESEKQYRLLTEKMADIVWIADMDLRTRYITPSIQTVLGFSQEERMNQTVAQQLTPDSLAIGMEAFARELALEEKGEGDPNRKATLMLEYCHKDGSTRWMETVISGLRNDQGTLTGLHGVSRDITLRKKALEELRESRELYTRLVNTIPDVIVRTDIEGKILFVNDYTLQISGYRREEIEGQNMLTFIAPEDRDKAVQNTFLMMERRLGPKEYQMIMKDGRKIPFEVNGDVLRDEDGKPYGLVQVCRDIRDRKRAEETLRVSEEKYRKIFEGTTEGIYQTTPEGRYISMNPAVARMFGYSSPQEMIDAVEDIGQQIYVSPKDREEMARLLREQNKVERYEVEVYRKDGSRFWISQNIHTVRDASGEIIYFEGTNTDITEHKKAEEEREKLASIVRHSSELVNLATLDGKMIFLNEAGCRMLGIEPNKLNTVSIEDIIPDRWLPMVRTELLPAIVTGGTWEGEIQYKNLRTGNLVDAYAMTFVIKDPVSMSPLYLANVSRDVTERKRAEKALEESEKHYYSLFDNMLNACTYCKMIYDQGSPVDFVCLYANNAVKSMIGLQDVIGRKVTEILPGIMQSDRALLETLARVALIGIPEKFEIYVKALKRWLSVSAYSPEKEFFVSIFEDITERKEAEENRLKLEQQLAQSQKMDAIGQLAGGVAHDFNNMLSVIIGNTEMALEKVDPSDTIHKSLQDILNAGMRSADLTRQLLAFARRQTINPKVLDLNDAVTGTLKMLQRLIGENIKLVWMPGQNLWRIKIDPSQVDQLLANLAVNARDAIDKAGKILIETSNTLCDQSYCSSHPECTPGEYVLLAVSDDGCGMDKEIQAKIFDPFFTAKKEGQGTGLGLATVYGIVKQNGGFINVYSELGIGTTFRIYIPRCVDTETASADDQAAAPIPRGTETILIVEDEEWVLNLSKQMLEALGYAVLAAGRTTEAISMVKAYHGHIDLLITDVVMPDMNGKELADRITAIKPGLKCLFMSGYTADIIARQEILEEGIQFISKPFSLKDMAVKVREALEGNRGNRGHP